MANNLRKFATESEYNSATLNYPSVSWITGTDTVHFDKVSPIPPKKLQLTYSDSSTYDIDCDTATTLTQSDVRGGSGSYKTITSAEIGNCISSIDSAAFNVCSGLTSVTIPNSVTSIGGYAFQGCSNLTSINIPSGVTRISGYDFNGCISLTSITIPNGVTNIDYKSFYNCSGLTSCTIGSGVTIIGEQAFYGCSSLTEIKIYATEPPQLGTNVFDNTNNCPIYVPSASVEAYKSSWSDYASRIQAIIG